MVGDREAGEPETVGLLDELLGVAGPVEEGEVGVAVQLRIGRGHLATIPNVCSYRQWGRRPGRPQLSSYAGACWRAPIVMSRARTSRSTSAGTKSLMRAES